MDDPYVIGAWIVLGVNAAVSALGLGQYLLNRPGQPFWWLARGGAAVAALYAVFCGIYALVAEPPPNGLAWVYILTPVVVSFFGEQLRLIAAQTVLEKHGFGSTAELRKAVTADQTGEGARLVATGIAHETLLRELAILALSAAVIAFLAWRAILLG